MYAPPSSLSTRERFQWVDASGPKNVRRISLSMPTTSYPRAPKWHAASDPIRPPDPVMIATLKCVSPRADAHPVPSERGRRSLRAKMVNRASEVPILGGEPSPYNPPNVQERP